MIHFEKFDNENTCPHCGEIIPDEAWHDNENYHDGMLEEMDVVERTEYLEDPDWQYDAECPHCGKKVSKTYRTRLVYVQTQWSD